MKLHEELRKTLAARGSCDCIDCDLETRASAALEKAHKALTEIVGDAPEERPERGDYTGNSDDDYEAGYELAIWGAAVIARQALQAIEGEK